MGVDGECNVAFIGFQERKVNNEEIVFNWHPENKIALDESYLYMGKDTPTKGHLAPMHDCLHDNFDYL